MSLFRFYNSTTATETLFEQEFPVDGRVYLAPTEQGTLQLRALSVPTRYVIPPAPILTPGPWEAGQVTVLDQPSPGGNTATIRVFATPPTNGGPLLKLVYRLDLTGAGFGSPVEVDWRGAVDYSVTVPGTAPITIYGVEAWVTNVFGAGPIFTALSTDLLLTTQTVIVESPIASSLELAFRNELYNEHYVADPAFDNDNAFMGFSAGEIAGFTELTAATSMSDAISKINAAAGGNGKTVKIALDFDGAPDAKGLTFNGLTAGSLSNGATYHGKVRPAHSVYMYAAPGRTPGLAADMIFAGWNKLHFKGVSTGRCDFLSNVSYPLPPMVFMEECQIGRARGHHVRGKGSAVLHLHKCRHPFGGGMISPAMWSRVTECEIYNTDATSDPFQFFGMTGQAFYAGQKVRVYFAGNFSYKHSQAAVATSNHSDFWQFGTGADVYDGYRVLMEFNVVCWDSTYTAVLNQGMFMGDSDRGAAGMLHNNILITHGGRVGFTFKDWFDDEQVFLYRNLAMGNPQGGDDYIGSTPVNITLDDTITAKVDGGLKRITENISSGTGNQGGNPANARVRNLDCRFIWSETTRRADNHLNIKNPYQTGNGGLGYDRFEDGTETREEAWAKILEGCRPINGWRSIPQGPINPDDWPTYPYGVLTAPPAPSLRVTPVIASGLEEDTVVSATLAQWANAEVVTQVWEVSDDDGFGAPLGNWTTYSTSASFWLANSLVGKHYRRRSTCSNMTGATEWISSSYGPIVATTAGGTLYTEDWKRSAVALTAGDMWTQVGAGGSAGAPFYSRSSSNVVTTVVADGAAPSGVAVRIGTSSNIFGRLWRDDIATDMASSWTKLDLTVRHKSRAIVDNQSAFGFPHVISTTAANTKVVGIGFMRGSAEPAQHRALNYRAILNDGTRIGSNVDDGEVAIYRMLLTDNGDGSFRCQAKGWLASSIEPVWQYDTTRTVVGFDPSDMVYAAFMVLNKTLAIEVQSYSVRVI